MEKYILTGGPGVGKTSVIRHLRDLGYTVVHEAARQIINQQKRRHTLDPSYDPILPQTCLSTFQLMVIARILHNEQKTRSKGAVFCDRGLGDGIGYCLAGNIPVPSGLDGLIERSGYTKVFLLEQLPAYKNDRVRHEDHEKATAIHNAILDGYRTLSLPVVIVPPYPVHKRVEMILDTIKQ